MWKKHPKLWVIPYFIDCPLEIFILVNITLHLKSDIARANALQPRNYFPAHLLEKCGAISADFFHIIEIDFMDFSVIAGIEAFRHTLDDVLATIEMNQ